MILIAGPQGSGKKWLYERARHRLPVEFRSFPNSSVPPADSLIVPVRADGCIRSIARRRACSEGAAIRLWILAYEQIAALDAPAVHIDMDRAFNDPDYLEGKLCGL